MSVFSAITVPLVKAMKLFFGFTIAALVQIPIMARGSTRVNVSFVASFDENVFSVDFAPTLTQYFADTNIPGDRTALDRFVTDTP